MEIGAAFYASTFAATRRHKLGRAHPDPSTSSTDAVSVEQGREVACVQEGGAGRRALF